MRAALLYDAHDFRIEELADPVPRPEEYVIGIKACGVCHSEIHQWDEKLSGLDYPRFIGHEVAGVVLKGPENDGKFKPGTRVALWVDGKGYAEKITVGEERIFPLADGVSFAEAMAEPIACTTNAVIRTNIQLGDTVALVGTGFMGLILLQQIRLSGAGKVIAVDLREEMLDLARRLGADITLNPQKDSVIEQVRSITNGRGVDISVEVGGVQSTLELAAGICRMEGKLVIFGYHPGERIIPDLGFWNWMAFDLINAHFRNQVTILRGTAIAMNLLNAGKLDIKPLITHRFPLGKINEAFMTACNKPRGFVKSVLVME